MIKLTLKNKIALFACAVTALAIFWASYEHRIYPFGRRTCRFLCVTTSLQAYANDHGGWLPNVNGDAFRSIQALYSNYIIFPPHLAGLSGDEKAVSKLVREGHEINQSVSGWVYFPGFRNDDDPRIAILWDKTEGIGMGGGRIGRGQRIVGFVNLAYKVIEGKDWPAFTGEQEQLRKSTLTAREAQKANPIANP